MNTQFQNYSASLRRLLICGFGSIGRRHARILQRYFPEIELSVLRSGKGPDCPELSFIKHTFFDIKSAILWNPDAAIVSSPASSHQEQSLILTRNKIPILVEKPLGIGNESQEDWDELLRLSQVVPVVVGYVLRHDPCVNHIKRLIDNQVLGKILDADFYCGSWLPDWRPQLDYRSCVSSQRSMGGGALLELSHEIDLAFYLLRDMQITNSFLTQSGLLDLDVEDQAVLFGHATNCSLITIRLNFCTRPPRRTVLLRCEHGEINWDILQGTVHVLPFDKPPQTFQSSIQPDDRFRLQAAHFIDNVCNSSSPICSLSEGLEVLRLITQAQTIATNNNLA